MSINNNDDVDSATISESDDSSDAQPDVTKEDDATQDDVESVIHVSSDAKTDATQDEDTTKGDVKNAIQVSSKSKINVLQVKDTTKGNVESATVLRSDNSFGGKPDVLLGSSSKRRKKKKRKKQSAALKPYEKVVFKLAERYNKATKEYRDRHSRSNKKKKNGWIKDFPKNYSKALSKLMKF